MLVSTGAFVSFVSVSDIGDNVFSFFVTQLRRYSRERC